MKTKLKSKNFKLQPPPSTINLHIIDNYFRCSGSVQIILITRNTIKHDPFGIYVGFRSVRIHFYQSDSVYLPALLDFAIVVLQ
ncbi:unnamed protein product [Brassica oleracea var. botrytis]